MLTAPESEKFFGEVYNKLYSHFRPFLSDSQACNELLKRIFIKDNAMYVQVAEFDLYYNCPDS